MEKFNINLEIIFSDELKFFSDIKDKNIFVYWNKVYEPLQLDLDEKIIKVLNNKNIGEKCIDNSALFILRSFSLSGFPF